MKNESKNQSFFGMVDEIEITTISKGDDNNVSRINSEKRVP